jgi:transcriptional regulator of acetoin/glycerol metabolism
MVFCKNNTITIADLPPHILITDAKLCHSDKDNISLPILIEQMEKEYIIEALERTKWHRENASRLLGITRKMLGDRINKYELKK